MSKSCRLRAAITVAAAPIILVIANAAVRAEPVSSQLLSGTQTAAVGACTIVKVAFHGNVTYLNHFPAVAGDELRIQVKPLSAGAGSARAVAREALRAPATPQAAIHGIELEPGPQGAVLSIHFRQTMAYRVAPGADAQSIVVAISWAGTQASPGCEPVFPASTLAAANGAASASAKSLAAPKQAAPTADPLTSDDPANLMLHARASLARNETDKAIQLLTKVQNSGAVQHAADAKELLGLARERKGQMAHAKAEYKEYLTQFPSNEGADRIRQRLAVMDSGDQIALAKLRRDTPRLHDDADGALQSRRAAADAPPPEDPNAWTVSHWGSVSTTYNLNQGKRDQFAAPLLQQGWNKDSTYQVYLNSLLSNIDYNADFDKAGFAGRLNFSGSQQSNFSSDQFDALRVSSLYVDGRWLQAGATARIGRQNLFNMGVLGRFDGAHMSYQPSEAFKLHVVAGSPVEWSFDSPFANDRFFYGVGADLPKLRAGFDTSAYVIEQRDGSIIDRQAIGLETRYTDKSLMGHGAIEYDTHFGGLNSALLTGTRIFDDLSTISLTLDYRKAPALFTANALFGQPYARLSDMLKRYGVGEIERLAWDRTAESYVATLSYSRQLNERLQLNLDGTILELSGTPASGGVDATAASGLDYYASAQLVASNVLRDGDTVNGGVRYALTQYDSRTLLELGTRYPYSKDWRINPMLRLGYVDYSTRPWIEYQITPSIRTSYYVMKDVALELEVGHKWMIRDTPAGRHNEAELMILTGVRYDFRSGK